MNEEIIGISTVAYNVIGAAVSAAALWGTVIRPYRSELRTAHEQIKTAHGEIQKLQTARVAERLDEHEERFEAMNRDIAAVIAKDESSRKGIYDRLERMDRSLERLNERTETTNRTVDKMDGRLAQVGEDVAHLAGKIER
jgi:peptidoglycan hydrolase CwlO-like protein